MNEQEKAPPSSPGSRDLPNERRDLLQEGAGRQHPPLLLLRGPPELLLARRLGLPPRPPLGRLPRPSLPPPVCGGGEDRTDLLAAARRRAVGWYLAPLDAHAAPHVGGRRWSERASPRRVQEAG